MPIRRPKSGARKPTAAPCLPAPQEIRSDTSGPKMILTDIGLTLRHSAGDTHQPLFHLLLLVGATLCEGSDQPQRIIKTLTRLGGRRGQMHRAQLESIR